MRAWIWFGSGFVLVFVAILLLMSVYEMHPSGNYVVECPLWRHYANELSRPFAARNLGPTSSNGSAFGENLFFHVLLSALGGGAAVGIGALVRKLAKMRGPA